MAVAGAGAGAEIMVKVGAGAEKIILAPQHWFIIPYWSLVLNHHGVVVSISSAILHFVHSMVQPVLHNLSASRGNRRDKHIRSDG